MEELEQVLAILNTTGWGGVSAPSYELLDGSHARQVRALINQAIVRAQQLTAERDRLKTSLAVMEASAGAAMDERDRYKTALETIRRMVFAGRPHSLQDACDVAKKALLAKE